MEKDLISSACPAEASESQFSFYLQGSELMSHTVLSQCLQARTQTTIAVNTTTKANKMLKIKCPVTGNFCNIKINV